jgi:hypothetical protein
MTKDLPTNCDLCRSPFRQGANRYDGRHVGRYRLTVCRRCYQSNSDGWSPAHEGVILDHLKSFGLAVPARNSKGWLPRD